MVKELTDFANIFGRGSLSYRLAAAVSFFEVSCVGHLVSTYYTPLSSPAGFVHSALSLPLQPPPPRHPGMTV